MFISMSHNHRVQGHLRLGPVQHVNVQSCEHTHTHALTHIRMEGRWGAHAQNLLVAVFKHALQYVSHLNRSWGLPSTLIVTCDAF